MTMRLAQYTKDEIIRRAVKAAFEREEAKLKKAEDRLARLAYDAIIPKAEQKLAAQMPPHWLNSACTLNLNVAGQHISLTLEKASPIPMRPKDSGGYNRHGTILAGPLATEIDAHLAALADKKKRKDAAESALTQMLSSITTLKRLAEVWPEGRQFYKHLEGLTAELPMIPVAKVNAMLGLKQAA